MLLEDGGHQHWLCFEQPEITGPRCQLIRSASYNHRIEESVEYGIYVMHVHVAVQEVSFVVSLNKYALRQPFIIIIIRKIKGVRKPQHTPQMAKE